jgi:hypothetical protein
VDENINLQIEDDFMVSGIQNSHIRNSQASWTASKNHAEAVRRKPKFEKQDSSCVQEECVVDDEADQMESSIPVFGQNKSMQKPNLPPLKTKHAAEVESHLPTPLPNKELSQSVAVSRLDVERLISGHDLASSQLVESPKLKH